MKNKKIILIGSIVLITVGIILAIIFIVIPAFNESETSRNRTNLTEENLKFVDITESLDNVKYNGEKVSIEIKQNEELKDLYINDQLVYSTTEMDMFIDKLYQFNDNILVFTSGFNNNSNKIHIYKNDGTFVKEIRDLIDDNMKIKEYEVLEKYVALKGLKIADNHYYVHKGDFADICDEALMTKIKINKEMPVAGDYRLEFDVDKGFVVTLEEGSQILFKDYQKDFC